MKKSLIVTVFTIFTGMLVMQCRHLPFEFPATVNNSTTLSDSVCFADQLLPIFVGNCAQSGCHDDLTRQSNINMSSYSNLTSTISGKLLVQIMQDTGSHKTPFVNGYSQLSGEQIHLVKKWVDQGMKNGSGCQPCDTITPVTFSGTINPIIQNSCIGCHSTTGTILATYNDVKVTVNNGKFLCTVMQDTCQAMPQGSAKLSDCKINQIKIWIKAGAPNN